MFFQPCYFLPVSHLYGSYSIVNEGVKHVPLLVTVGQLHNTHHSTQGDSIFT